MPFGKVVTLHRLPLNQSISEDSKAKLPHRREEKNLNPQELN